MSARGEGLPVKGMSINGGKPLEMSPFVVLNDPKACPADRPWGVFDETEQGSGKPKGQPHGCHPNKEAAGQQAKALYANVPEASSAQGKQKSIDAPPPGITDDSLSRRRPLGSAWKL